MRIRIGFDLEFEVGAPTPVILMLYVHPSRDADVEGGPEHLQIEPRQPVAQYIDVYGNRCARVMASAAEGLRIRHEAVVRDSGLHDPAITGMSQFAVADLPPETIQYLLASRYCEVDKLMGTAWELFGKTPLGWQRVAAVLDWVHANVQFGYAFARPTKTAADVLAERQGVCRDFQHLAITFCRCLNIPARYVTGYLGDIGVPAVPDPMDFSAWMEVYLRGDDGVGRWMTVDARHNKPRIGRILMAVGRDATDVALTTSFGNARLARFVVVTDELR